MEWVNVAASDLGVATARVRVGCGIRLIQQRQPLQWWLASAELCGNGRTSLSTANREMVGRLKDPAGFYRAIDELRAGSRDPDRFDPNAYMGRALQRHADHNLDHQRSRGAEILDRLSPENRSAVAGMENPTAFLVALAEVRDQSPRPRGFDPNVHMGEALTHLAGQAKPRQQPGSGRPAGPGLPGA